MSDWSLFELLTDPEAIAELAAQNERARIAATLDSMAAQQMAELSQLERLMGAPWNPQVQAQMNQLQRRGERR